MKFQLIVSLKVYRKKFILENFIGSDDIFALVKSGSFSFESKSGSYIVSANEGAVFRKNELYNRRIISPATIFLFRYKSNDLIFEDEKITFLDNSRIKSTLCMLELLDDGIFKNEYEFRASLFSDIITQYHLENNIYTVPKKSADNPIENAVEEINLNFHKKIALSDIGKSSGLSYSQFTRRFKQATGFSPSDYITTLRLQKAKSMLINTDLMIKDVAAACGFDDQYYFSNFFKKQLHISPKAFRKSAI